MVSSISICLIFKFWSRDSAKRLARAKDYPERAREALVEMHRQVGPLRFDRNGLAVRGVLVRHLVMPGQTAEARAMFEWLAKEISPDTYMNIMGQYAPQYQVGEIAADGRRGRGRDRARAWPSSTMSVLRVARDCELNIRRELSIFVARALHRAVVHPVARHPAAAHPAAAHPAARHPAPARVRRVCPEVHP